MRARASRCIAPQLLSPRGEDGGENKGHFDAELGAGERPDYNRDTLTTSGEKENERDRENMIGMEKAFTCAKRRVISANIVVERVYAIAPTGNSIVFPGAW